MTLTAKRYANVDVQLQEMREQLMSLSAEIRKATPSTDKSSRACMAALKAADALENVRFMLAVEEARRQLEERLQPPVPIPNQVRKPSARTSIDMTVSDSVPVLKRFMSLLS
jgi:hypothetical protein